MSRLQVDAKKIEESVQIRRNSLLPPDLVNKEESKEFILVEPSDPKTEFIERKHFFTSFYEYERNGTDPGLVLIFNQQNFKYQPFRDGSRRDVNELISCMSRLGYNITENNVFNDLTEAQARDTIKKITSQDLSAVNSVIVFVLTHGDNLNRIHFRDDYIFSSDLWLPFTKCKTLNGKPKIFIFQACKGEQVNTVGNHNEDKTKVIELVPNMTFHQNYLDHDMLVVYATTEGNVSFRDPKTGTWFIQELCKCFTAYGRRDDIVALIIRTTKCVAKIYYDFDEEQNTIRKQLPVFVSTLTKKFYLNRSKDRNIILKLLNDQIELKSQVTRLETRIEDLVKTKK